MSQRRIEMELLGEQLAEHGAHLDAAMHGFLTNLRRFDEGQGWALQYAQTCAHWLSWRLGMDPTTAREQLRVAHRLAELPLVDVALRLGKISYSKVRAITRVAVTATELELVDMAARMTAAQLDTVCRKLRTTQRKPADPNDISEQRYITYRDREDGMTQVTAYLRPEEALRLFTVLDAIAAERTREASAEAPVGTDGAGTREASAEAPVGTDGAGTREASAEAPVADAGTRDASAEASGLADAGAREASAEASVGLTDAGRREASVEAEVTARGAGGDGATSQESPQAGAATATPGSRKVRRHRFDRCDALMELVERQARGSQPDRAPIELVVTVSAAALSNSPSVDPLDRAGVASDGTCLTIETVRQLACDAGVVVLVEDEHGTPLSVGRKQRTVTTALKRALARRDPHCQFPGCMNRMFMEGHHLRHWADGGATELSNMINLCTLHHNLLHAHHFVIEMGSPPRFFDELGRPIHHVPPRPQPANLGWGSIRAANADLGIRADTNASQWDGDAIDYDLAVAELCRLEDLLCAPDEWTGLGVPGEGGDGTPAEAPGGETEHRPHAAPG